MESLTITKQSRETGLLPDNAPWETSAAAPTPNKLRFVVGNSGIDVRLSNTVPISALRFDIAFEIKINYRTPNLALRAQHLNNHINFQDNVMSFVLSDIDGKGIAPGNGSILNIPFEGGQHFDVACAFASTRTGGVSEINYSVSREAEDEETIILEQNDPNSFSGRTRLDFRIPNDADTKLIIYDAGGALIRTLVDSMLESGSHSVEWDGEDDSGNTMESGIYIYRLYAGVYSVTKKMVYLSEASPGK